MPGRAQPRSTRLLRIRHLPLEAHVNAPVDNARVRLGAWRMRAPQESERRLRVELLQTQLQTTVCNVLASFKGVIVCMQSREIRDNPFDRGALKRDYSGMPSSTV